MEPIYSVENLESKRQYSVSETNHSLHQTAKSQFILEPLNKNAGKTITVTLTEDDTKILWAAAEIVPAEFCDLAKLQNVTDKALKTAAFLNSVWINPEANAEEVLPVILYLALRRARIMGRQNIITLVPQQQHRIAQILNLVPLVNTFYIQQIDYAISKAYELTFGDLKKTLQNNMAEEILSTHALWLDHFFQGEWVNAVYKGTITKEQYIWSLFNIHQYVRHTTRLAARCVAYSDNIELRNHYLNHLKGEINHELLIERDLKRLEADVDFLKTRHVPHYATKEFMVVQESTIGFYQDPVLMLACPLAAEGFAAHLEKKPDFLHALYQAIENWGIRPGKDGAIFLTSHVKTDGGDDGHWQLLVNTIRKYINNEFYLQQFLSIYHAAKNGFERSFNMLIEDMAIWSAKPKPSEILQREYHG